MPSTLPFPLPLPLPSSSSHLSSIARRILHAINTTTSPSHLPPLLSLLLRRHLLSDTTISSSFLRAALILRHLPLAFSPFSLLPRPHVFLYNSFLRFLPRPSSFPPLLLFSHMLSASVSPNRYTFPLLLNSISDPFHGGVLHAHIVRSGFSSDLYVRNSLLQLYSAVCGDINGAQRVFDEMPMREVVAWTTLIKAYNNCGRSSDAIAAFRTMQFSGIAPNRVTMVNALDACAAHGALDMGVWIHDYLRKIGWELDVVLGTTLIDMYGKCGRIDVGMSVFLSMREKNVYTWNSVIGGLALAKSGNEALRWFYRMELEGFRPDSVTLIGILCACSHSGLVDVGRQIFESILSGRYGFGPGIKHYGCAVDILGRAGLLDVALDFIEKMPFQPNAVIWGSLLAGCRARGNSRLSEIAARRLVELEPRNVAHYVVLSNLYAEMGRWREAEELRRWMKERGLRKNAGLSLAESL
ncbi:pentatricopeptide repeat-containing protein At5g66520-like [Typha latifolia]|uniref:pentatricopeptide repeat-containing protein At5g66520-like n=1 Tax=Typha latifolia TaxID=4733 RepID=UPI003C2F8876